MTHYSDKIDHMKRLLRDAGIDVLDARHTERRTEYISHGSLSSDRIPYYRTEKSAEDVVWDLRMNSEKVHDMINLQNEHDHYKRQSNKAALDLLQTQRIVGRYQSQTGQLRMVLDEHPEIKEQWDEFMILLKMAGLDADVLKLIT
tara:strand:+ start:568 stop:1002 length:435 start_codon:yes stop_codon:yes gene_type:complete